MRGKISERKLKRRTRRKTSPLVVETISAAAKNNSWYDVRRVLAASTRKLPSVNLFEIDEETKEGDTVVVPGKILSKGYVSKMVRVCALSFSEKAREKLKESKSEVVSILEEIKKNPKAEGIKIIK